MIIEIELKLRISREDAQQLFHHPLVLEHTVNAPQQHLLVSTYFDTPAHQLRQQGFTLRIRKCDQRYYQTVKDSGKRIGNLYQRQEWEQEINNPQPNLALLEPDIRERLEQIIDKQPLQAIFTTEFQRTSWDLAFVDGSQIELATDFGKIVAGNVSEPISELELELKNGDPEKLNEIADVLAKSIPLSVENVSKAGRGYKLCSV